VWPLAFGDSQNCRGYPIACVPDGSPFDFSAFGIKRDMVRPRCFEDLTRRKDDRRSEFVGPLASEFVWQVMHVSAEPKVW
jgi:hypothetical protein